MPGKWKIEEIKMGQAMETTFWANPVKESEYRFRATHLDGKRAPKVILCDDAAIRAGVPCLVKIKSIHKAKRADRGYIEVEHQRSTAFKLEGVYVDPVISCKLQILLESGMNILLDGPQGCGKTVLAQSIATSLGMEFIFFNCGAVIEATDFLASIQVRASKSGHPVTDFIKTDLLNGLEAAQQHRHRRYLVFLDEFNRAQENARNILMPALDTTRRIFHPIDNRFMDIPDNVQFIAAVNRGNEFSGTFGIDAAQLDRFAPLQMTYMPPDEEKKLLHSRHPELSKAQIDRIVQIADTIRKSPEIECGLSVRATEEVCLYLKHPLMEGRQKNMFPEILKSSFCGRFSGIWNDHTTDAGHVWTLIQRKLRQFAKK